MELQIELDQVRDHLLKAIHTEGPTMLGESCHISTGTICVDVVDELLKK